MRDGDPICIRIDVRNLQGSLDYVGSEKEFIQRPANPLLQAIEGVPDDTRLWAALQNVCGGSWGGCVYDADTIIEKLRSS